MSDEKTLTAAGIRRMLKRLVAADAGRPAASQYAPSGREMQRYQLAALVAAVPAAAMATYYLGPRVLYMMAAAFPAAAAVEVAFALVRRKPAGGGPLVLAVLLALILPPEIPLWMAAVGAAFAALFGKEIFGGTGHYIFNPVLLGKAFLLFSFPQVVRGPHFGAMVDSGSQEAWIVCSAVAGLGAAAMILARGGNLQILAGLAVPAGAVTLGMYLGGRLGAAGAAEMLTGNGFLFGACFLACDPAGSPRGNLGKWIYGAIVGLTAVLVQSYSDYGVGMMTAILLGNLFTPLIDMLTAGQAPQGPGK